MKQRIQKCPFIILLKFIGICLVYLLIMSCLSGCVESFTAGVATGVSATYGLAQAAQSEANEVLKQAEDSKTEVITMLDELEAQKTEIEKAITKIQDKDVKTYLENLSDPELVTKIEKIKTADWSDPKVISGYGLGVLSIIIAGYQKYQRVKEKAV